MTSVSLDGGRRLSKTRMRCWENVDLVCGLMFCDTFGLNILLEYAAAFFLLGQSPKDAVNVCIRQLGDFQAAITIARVVEQSNDGPIFLDILKTSVLPIAFQDGNRWLASWAFWLLHRRDLSVRVLVVCKSVYLESFVFANVFTLIDAVTRPCWSFGYTSERDWRTPL